MRNTINLIIIAGFISVLFAQCTDFLETDLSDRAVRLLSPADNAVTNLTSQTFWWDTLDGASEYRITIVAPSFDSIISLVATEITEENTFQTVLPPGKYQWRVTAINSAYQSKETTFSLTILNDSTQNLANQSVQLVAPANNAILGGQQVKFLWKQLQAANIYNIQVASPDFSNSTFIKFDERTPSDNFTITLPEGEYRWRVRGENDISVTLYTENGFEVDQTPPAAPALVAPLNNAIVTLPVTQHE